jgi:hypothetical protein
MSGVDSRDDSDQIRNQRELLSLTGADSAGSLADQLFEYVDPVIELHDEGITIITGFLFEDLLYPFTLAELHETAKRLEQAENDHPSRS